MNANEKKKKIEKMSADYKKDENVILIKECDILNIYIGTHRNYHTEQI